MTTAKRNANAWGVPDVLTYFDTNRRTEQDVYPSERFFLMDRLNDGMSILDVGCAQGGFVEIVEGRSKGISYTGLDINADMIARARARYPRHTFHHVDEASFDVLKGRQFDLVLVFGILHLHEAWRDTLRGAWRHTRKSLIFDLRQTGGETIQDIECSFMTMNFGGGRDVIERLPYIIVNAAEAQSCVEQLCEGAGSIAQYGYRHAITKYATSPVKDVMAVTWCAER